MELTQETKKILFADDETGYARAISGYFKTKKINYEFDFVHTVQDAIDNLEYNAFDYDLIIVDLKFKKEELAGLKIIKHLSKKLIEIPWIIITAYANEKSLKECLKERPYKLLEKPFDMRSLKETIQEVFKKVSKQQKRPHMSTARRLLNQIKGRNKVSLIIEALESLNPEQYENVAREMPMIQTVIDEESRYQKNIDDSWRETGEIPLQIINISTISVENKLRKLASGEKVTYGPFVYLRWTEDGKLQQYYAGKIEKITNPDLIEKLYIKYQQDEKIREIDKLKTIPLLYEKYCS